MTDIVPARIRNVRSRYTHERILDALLELLAEGNHDPTTQQVAQRAGVVVRTVFHHFSDVGALYREATVRQSVALRNRLEPFDTNLDVEERTILLIDQRDEMYAEIAPLRRALRTNTNHLCADLHESVALRTAMTRQIRNTYKYELRRHTDPVEALSRLDAATSYEIWDYFRLVQRASRTNTRAFMTRLVVNEVGAFGA
jgi:TetR/AcrR family transcriptional regulator, regulator of autoinduction and epiphytic fitness